VGRSRTAPDYFWWAAGEGGESHKKKSNVLFLATGGDSFGGKEVLEGPPEERREDDAAFIGREWPESGSPSIDLRQKLWYGGERNPIAWTIWFRRRRTWRGEFRGPGGDVREGAASKNSRTGFE